MLELRDIDAGYGRKQVLAGVSMTVAPGELVAIIGPNGAGKSTVLKVAGCLLPRWRGDMLFEGAPFGGDVRRGIELGVVTVQLGKVALAPQGSRVFATLTVAENLLLGGIYLPSRVRRRRLDDVLAMFPTLTPRLADPSGRLSGGEQQMVALGRALMSRPKLLLLDEPSLGLAPKVMADVLDKVRGIHAQTGASFLVVEQKVETALRLCDRVYGLKLGRVALHFASAELQAEAGRARLRDLFL